jgi:hypothetical protein
VALVRAGDRQRGEPLLRHIFLEPMEERGMWRGDTLLHLGETGAALVAFRALNAADRHYYFNYRGFIPRFIMENSPAWAPVRATPEYPALLEELDRHAAEHRRKLQEMDLPIK